MRMTKNPPVKVSFKAQMLLAREDAIIRSVNLMLAQKGFDAMTVDEVAADVGIAKASLYKHFPSKEDLAAAAMVSRQTATFAGSPAPASSPAGTTRSPPMTTGGSGAIWRSFWSSSSLFSSRD